MLGSLLGYRRSFVSFQEAERYAQRYGKGGHETSEEIRYHAAMSGVVRESDFPVFYFLSEAASQLCTVFDLGGNVGNLFYTYQAYLNFPPNLKWLVYDLPADRAAGELLAKERNESRIHFVDALAAASGVALFIASGSLHYFEASLAGMLRTLPALPRRVVVNRTPCSSGDDLFTIQDAMNSVVPCKLPGRQRLVSEMAELGYKLKSEWPVYERRLWVPTHPDCSHSHYSGFYFEKV